MSWSGGTRLGLPTTMADEYRLRERSRALSTAAETDTISAMASAADDKLDTVLAALAQLTEVVGSLASSVAQIADRPSGSAAPAERAPTQLVEDPGYSELTPRSPENQGRRVELALALGIVGQPAGEALIEWGARGFFRGLEREEGQLALNLPIDIARRLVADASLEDPREAIEMSHELLKVWDATPAPDPQVDAPTVAIGKGGEVQVAVQDLK